MEQKKIIVCDDDAGILDVVEMVLEMEGYDVSKVIDSTSLLNIVSSVKPDLIILDLWMPVLSGYDITKMLRSDNRFNNIPILILSASRNEREKALKTGANHFMAKPFDIEEMVKSVNNLIFK